MFKNRRLATFLFLIHHTELGAWIPDHLWLCVRSRACLREPGEETVGMDNRAGKTNGNFDCLDENVCRWQGAIVFSYSPIQNQYFLRAALLP